MKKQGMNVKLAKFVSEKLQIKMRINRNKFYKIKLILKMMMLNKSHKIWNNPLIV